jgi:hypothetical protein
VAESCDGVNDACPADAVAGAGPTCRAAAGGCDVAETCDGVSPTCPADDVVAGGTPCRAVAGACDVAETCDGVSPACPPDSVAGAFVECRAAAGPCDLAENCDGTNTDCPADALQPSSITCRAAAGACDVAETCTGAGAACPADTKSTAVCRAAAGTCDVAESCDGASDTCPADGLEPTGTTCRAAADVCDLAELCTGLTGTCPPDLFLPDDTPCTDNDSCTSPDTCQSGVCTGTPDPTACADHYLCYKAKASAFAQIAGVTLADQFEAVTATVVKPKQLCTPADKNGEGTTDDVTHLKAYAIRQTPRHVAQTVTTINQFGTLSLTTIKADTLLVPTAKSLVSTPPAPDLNTIGVNHYKCYKAKVTPGTPRFPRGVTASVGDQFTAPKLFAIKKVKHLCTPVDKNGEGMANPDAHLVCYLARPASGQPKHSRTNVFVNNQFGPETMTTIKERELCVPSVKIP